MAGLNKYKSQRYWDERYKEEEAFDWFCDSLDDAVHHYLKTTDRILIVGCGNSVLGSSLYIKGYHNIVNIDFSPVVIEQMKKRSESFTGMRWHVMDMLALKFDSETFDVVLDKGSIDALMVDQGDVWDPRQEVRDRAEKALSEASRVLKIGGHFISITFSQPHFRGKLLYQPNKFVWNVEHSTLGSSFHYFTYTTTKRMSPEEVALNQKEDYTYSTLYSGSNKQTVFKCEEDSDDFLYNIGDIYRDE